jgi:hypothetical protein
MQHGGVDLEKFEMQSSAQAMSIFTQVALYLAFAEAVETA